MKFNQKYILKSNSKVSFENKIRIKWMKSNPQFGSIEHFYQTHPKIGVPGVRPTLSRFKNYELMNFVNSDSDILDVGGNVGMFSSYVSQFVKKIDIVEFDKALAEIAKDVILYLQINNVNVFNIDFKQFKSENEYDLIFSFAIHKWIGESIDSYVNRLLSFLKPGGTILMESHPGITGQHTLDDFLLTNPRINILKSGITDDHLGHLRSFHYFKKA